MNGDRRGRRWIVATLLAGWCGVAGASTMLRPVVTSHGNYGETFTFIADLDDGTYVQLSLGFTNLGPGSVKAICRALVIPPGGPLWQASTRVGRDDWSWTEGESERLSIASCAAAIEGPMTRVEVPLDGGVVQLRFSAPPTRRLPADASFGSIERYYRTEILLYRTRLDATVQLPRSPSRVVAGSGYLDHTRSTIRPKDLAAEWVRFRALRGDRGVVLLARRAHDGRINPAWACDPPGRCRHFTSYTVDRVGEGKSPSFRVTFPSDRDPVRIDSGRLLYRDDPIGDLGVLGKVAAPFFGSPVTYVYRARLDDGHASPIEGILEVELASE